MLKAVPLKVRFSARSTISRKSNLPGSVVVVAKVPWIRSSERIIKRRIDFEVLVHYVVSIGPKYHHILIGVESFRRCDTLEVNVFVRRYTVNAFATNNSGGRVTLEYVVKKGFVTTRTPKGSTAVYSYKVVTFRNISLYKPLQQMGLDGNALAYDCNKSQMNSHFLTYICFACEKR